MKHSDSIASLAAALVAAQTEVKTITKDSVNPHFKNRYASLDAMIEAVRPVLAKHGLAIIQAATLPTDDEHGRLASFVVETMLIHKSGEWLTGTVVMPVVKVDPQGAGGALTYGRRYGLSALLSLATDDDDDGNAASDAPARNAAPAARPAAKANGAAPACPKCQGGMWDNRDSKKNPRQPDFKCKDKACDGVIWPPKAAATVPRDDAPPPDDDEYGGGYR